MIFKAFQNIMNFIPETVESKSYVGSLVTEFQQPYSEDLNSEKTTTFEDCYDSIATLGTTNGSPSAETEFKRGDTCLEDLDTNADTTSVPDSEFVAEYFDIYGPNEALNKTFSGLSAQQKLEEQDTFEGDVSKEVDTTTTTTAASESGFKPTSFESSSLFFEDEFRCVSSRPMNGHKPLNMSYELWDKNDFVCFPHPSYPLPFFKLPEGSKDFYSLPTWVKEDLIDKVELASNSFAQITNTMVNMNGGQSKGLNTNVGNNLVNGTFIGSNLVSPTLLGGNLVVGSLGPGFPGNFDVKRSPFLNPVLYSLSALMEAELYMTPTLGNKCYNLVPNFPVNCNYCVYIGAEYNKLVCSCNLNRLNGSNSHSTNCNVVAGGVELSTESWPISKASQMHTLISTWDRVFRNYKRCPVKSEFSTYYVPEDYKPTFFVAHEEDKGVKQNTTIMADPEALKNANNLISEITGIKIKVENTEQFTLRTGVPEHLRPEDITKRRKTNKHKHAEPVAIYPKEFDLSALAAGLDDDGKLDRKDLQSINPEKVSGVWYDTNRHLWRVVYMKGNKRKTQGFSSLKLGYEEARRKAIQMRHEMVALRHTDKL